VRLGHACAASVVLAGLLDAVPQPLFVAHRSPRAWQLADGSGRVVACLLSPGSLRLPHAFLVPFGLPLEGTPSIFVGAGRLSIDGSELAVTRWWSPARPRHAELADRIDSRAARTLLRTWRSQLGGGEGLTPYADDVLCGALVALLAAGDTAGAELAHAVAAALLEATTTATSAGLLRQAAGGRCIDELAAYLSSLTGDGSEVRRLAALEGVGHSSGRGMAEGVRLVVGPLRADPMARPVHLDPGTGAAA
jgi:hypothetical protein